MNPLTLKYCPSTLQPGFTTYSAAAQKDLFGSRTKKVSQILPFGPPGTTPELTRDFNEKRKLISISGVQEKYSLLQEKNQLKLTATKGSHILKPISAERLERVEEMPANEHLCMQLAKQVFQIKTAACGLIFFNDGSPAYITRRFDYKADGSKYQVEDFATLLGRSPEKEGDDYKYNASYLDIAVMIQKHVPAAPVALLQFFKLLVFNYLIANGDAHLKNFSLIETEQGDFMLAPAYDLICTSLHINDSSLALQEGLYEGDFYEASYKKYGTYTRASFLAFAEKAGIRRQLAASVMDEIQSSLPKLIEMVGRSYLTEQSKKLYLDIVQGRMRSLQLAEA
jgi:serine/threonine-protein kinase HipA